MRQKHRVCAACTYLSKQQLAQVTTRLLTSRLPLVRLVGCSVDLIREIYLHRSLLLASSCYCARANSCMELRGGMGIEPSSIGSLDVDGSRRFFSPSKCVTFVRSILAVCAARACACLFGLASAPRGQDAADADAADSCRCTDALYTPLQSALCVWTGESGR